MSNIASLMPGPEGKKRHAIKRDLVLTFVHKVHVATPAVLASLLGTPVCNVYPFVRRLVQVNLLRQVTVPKTDVTGSGEVLMLTDDGVAEAVKADEQAEHVYDTRPEAVRSKQIAHDIEVAALAASWVRQGATLKETDRIGRQAQRVKVADAVLDVDGELVAIEQERTAKNPRELINALTAASKLSIPVLWICASKHIENKLSEPLSSENWPTWTLTSGNTWIRGESRYVSPYFRAKHFVVSAKDSMLLDTPAGILARMENRRKDFLLHEC
jgi:hypothetical protein